jgi:hypothetical protein
MIDLDAICRQSMEHQHAMLDAAAERRLLSVTSGRPSPDRRRSPAPLRTQVAAILRQLADRLAAAPSRA